MKPTAKKELDDQRKLHQVSRHKTLITEAGKSFKRCSIGILNIAFALSLASLLNIQTLHTQVLSTQPTISSSSNSYLSGSIQIDYTIGELAAVTTLVSPNYIFTQGLHQPDKFTVGIEDWNKTLYKQVIFPNPFTDQVILELESNEYLQLEFQVLDATGRLIHQFSRQKLIAGKNQFSFDFNDLAAGAYFFRIHSVDGIYWSTIPLIKQYK
jgi:hypothetical protein